MGESLPQARALRYARGKGLCAHRNYFGPGAEVGWPDVEIFLSVRRIVLIEFKVPGKEMRKIQKYRGDLLRAMGHDVRTCHSFEEAKQVIDSLLDT